MSRRRSAFSVYKSSRQPDSKKDDLILEENVNVDVENNMKQSPKIRGKKNAKKSDNECEKQESKHFSRASKLRHSIGSIGMTKRKRKKEKTKSEKGDSDSDNDDNKRHKKITQVNARSYVNDNKESASPGYKLPSKTFEWLINPVKPTKFFSDLWEKKPLLVKRHESQYYDGIFSTGEIDRILRENDVKFSVNLDVTSYKNGERETHNPPGRALAPIVWDFYENGCSVRMLNPQIFSNAIWKLNATLQEYFGSFVGANIYLTPPNTQGFAPHYDDIEAFVLQLEGKKHWRIYTSINDNEVLPRLSSGNFKEEDIGEPILNVTLEPGDLLYFPRGMIHQADTMGGPHSLHITLSTYQKTSWGDLMEQLVPQALQLAIDEDIEFRRGLPLGYLNSMGVINSETTSDQRTEFIRHVEQLLMKLVSYLPVDGAVDQMGIKNIHDSLPPVLSEEEQSCSVFDNGAGWEDGQVVNAVTIDDQTSLRLLRRDVVRLVCDDEGVVLHHTLENSRTYHQNEPQFLELTFEAQPIIEYFIKLYPKYVTVNDLPGKDSDFKIDLVTVLYEKGILITEQPLAPLIQNA